ncbi:MAG TPA: hypothetical protein VN374_08160 [Desulfitobacteriaceae bacterium]|nr:hypothetical protein [Desulfitobacteriaceae bacterium]
MIWTILSFILLVIWYLLLGILLLLALVILVPYTYEIEGGNIDQLQIQGLVSWLFGGLKINFRRQARQKAVITPIIFGFPLKIRTNPGPARAGLPEETRPEKRKAKNKSAPKTKKPKKSSSKRKVKAGKKTFPFRLYLKKDILQAAFSLLGRVLKYCLPQRMSANARIGFADPMLTGLLCALSTQSYLLPKAYDLHLRPVFDSEIYKGSFLIGGKLWLAQFIGILIGFLTSRPIRNILLAHLKLKIKGGNYYGG